MTEHPNAHRVRAILAAVKPLAAEFYKLTGKPLGVTGEVAEYVAAEHLGLELADPRQPGYDAIRRTPERDVKIQIKGRAIGEKAKLGQRLGRIKQNADCDVVMLVLLHNATLEPHEIFEADYGDVCKQLRRPGRSNERGAMAVSKFKQIGRRVWPTPTSAP